MLTVIVGVVAVWIIIGAVRNAAREGIQQAYHEQEAVEAYTAALMEADRVANRELLR